MPLDGHSYLVSQGWGGKGTALREGAISRPIAISQKKNLAGLGKDRDEAFPFWDHLFSAAAKSIVVKCLSDDEDSSAEASSSNEVVLKRTSTGILSTRRPIEGTPATSGTVTPDESISRLSLMANAKRDAARRNLYSRFFKGPVIGPETIAAEEKRLAALVSEAFEKQDSAVESVTASEHIEIKTGKDITSVDIEALMCKRKTSKSAKSSDSDSEDEAAKRQRNRRRKEERKRKREEEAEEVEKKKSKKSTDDKHDEKDAGTSVDIKTTAGNADDNEQETKVERRRRREEKKRLKALKFSEDSSTAADIKSVSEKAKKPHSTNFSKSKKEKKSLKTDSLTEDTILDSENLEEKKKKKKRKRADDDEE